MIRKQDSGNISFFPFIPKNLILHSSDPRQMAIKHANERKKGTGQKRKRIIGGKGFRWGKATGVLILWGR